MSAEIGRVAISWSRSWTTNYAYWHADAGEELHNKLLAQYGDDYVLRVPSGHGRRVWKLPTHSVYFELTTAAAQIDLAIGTDYSGGELVNRQVLEPAVATSGSSSSTLSYCAIMWFSDEGFFIGTTNVRDGPPGGTLFSNYGIMHSWLVSTLLDANNDVDQSQIYVARTAYGVGNRTAWRDGIWTRCAHYDVVQGMFTESVITAQPFMVLNNFVKSVNGAGATLYGVKTYSPLPDYPELGFVRLYGSDRFGEGAIVTEGLRQYYACDMSLDWWINFASMFSGMPWYGTTGRIAFNWA